MYEEYMLSIIDTSFQLPKGQYREEVHPKRHIVLHYTAGFSVNGALATWKKTPFRDGTAFIIGRDGVIYQVFDPRYWAVHIYRHFKGEDKRLYDFERQSIGIEIVNVAWLDEKGGVLHTYTKKPFCKIDETDRYVATPDGKGKWAAKKYWQSYTNEQYAAVEMLIRELSRDFQIPLNVPPPAGRIDPWTLEQLAGYTGVTTHCNYRKDKFDVGPAWDWERIGFGR